MKIRHLLVVAAAAAAVADGSAFQWEPAIQQPNPSLDVTQAYQLESMRFITDVPKVTNTDVMPVWIDEDGNEIAATNCIYDPSWAPGDFTYTFNLSKFKVNGEYILRFPEGMLVNADGELSDLVETPYTVEVPELATSMFDDFSVTSVYPDFSQPQGIWDDQLVTINTNHNRDIAFTRLTIVDNTTGESVVNSSNFATGRKLNNSSEIKWNVVGTYKFYEDHQYTAEFVFYNGTDEYSSEGVPTPVVARVSYDFTGKVESYKYSSITLLSINPAPYTKTISQASEAVFTYEFSGPVNVYRAETPLGQFGTNVYPESCFSSNEDKTVWTINLSDNAFVKSIDAELVLYVYARDLEGFQLQGDFGEETQSCFTAGWSCDIGGKSIVVSSPKNGETLDSLTEIVVKSESGEAMSYNYGAVTIQNLLGEVLGTLVYDGETGAQSEIRFTKWRKGDSWEAEDLNIVNEGSFVIYFPTGCFVFGEEFSSVNSRSLYSGFQVSGENGETPDDPVVNPTDQEVFYYDSVLPDPSFSVKSLDSILMWFPSQVSCEEFEVKVYSTARAEVTTGTGMYDWGDPNLIVITFAEPIKEDGRYEVVIPKRVIGNDEFFTSDGKAGICNPEFRFYYTVETAGNDDPNIDPAEQETFNYTSVSPESGSTVESLEVIKLWFPDVPTCEMFEAYLYKADAVGSEDGIVATASVLFDWEDDLLVNATFTEKFAVDGEYVFVIPARMIGDDAFFASDKKSGICNPEIRLNYTVKVEESGVASVAEAGCVDVFDLQGRIVLHNATSADVKTLEKGIYIIAGKKLVVK